MVLHTAANCDTFEFNFEIRELFLLIRRALTDMMYVFNTAIVSLSLNGAANVTQTFCASK